MELAGGLPLRHLVQALRRSFRGAQMPLLEGGVMALEAAP